MLVWFRSRKVRLHGAALLFFALLAWICLYPLIIHHATHGAGYDYFFPHWTFWWIRHALTTEGLKVYESNFVMFPFTSNYAYNALTAFWFPVWAALEPLIGTLNAVTVIIALACTLNGYALFVLLLDEDVSPGLALIGGAALQIFPITRYFYYNTHINLMDWFWLPVTLLVWKRIAANTSRPRRLVGLALALGVIGWAVVLTDLQVPIFVAFVLGPYALLTLYRSSQRRYLIAAGLIAAVVAAVLLWLAGPLSYILSFHDQLIPGPVKDRPVIDFPSGFFSMSETWWEWSTPSLGAFVITAALATLILAALKPSRFKREGWFWLLVALPPLLIAIGPTLPPFRLMYDHHEWQLPDALADGSRVRDSGRDLHGQSLDPSSPALALRRVFGLGGVFFLVALGQHLYGGGPVRPVLPAYHTYELIGQERGHPYDDYVVLEVPTGAGTGEVLLGDADAITFQYYGITHGKRMVNGFISRAPLENFWYLYRDDPMLSWLGQRRLLEAERVTEQLRERIFRLADRLYRRAPGLSSGATARSRSKSRGSSIPWMICSARPSSKATRSFTGRRGTRTAVIPAHRPKPRRGWLHLTWALPATNVIWAGVGTEQELVAGLTLRWAGDQPQARLYVDLPPDAYTITVSMQAFNEPRRVHLLVNGEPLPGDVTVSEAGLQAYTFDLPADRLGDGHHAEIALAYDNWLVPAEIGQSADQRRLAVAVDWIQFARTAP